MERVFGGERDRCSAVAHLRRRFDRSIKLAFRGSAISFDGGLLLHRELDDALCLTDMAGGWIIDSRTGLNGRHCLSGLLRQSISSRFAGVGILLDEVEKRHSVIGHRCSPVRFQVSHPTPLPKIGDDRPAMHPSRALRYAGGSARGHLHHVLGRDRVRGALLDHPKKSKWRTPGQRRSDVSRVPSATFRY
jgi:hypothetical protein